VGDPATGETFRTIDELAQLCGGFCWVETALFKLTGAWSVADGPEALRIFCSVSSSRHAAVAGEWRGRLPVRAGVDPVALVVPRAVALSAAIEGLTQTRSIQDHLATLSTVVLPDLRDAYRQTLQQCAPVREGPVMATLAAAIAGLDQEIDRLADLLQQA
jgi:hypothetical protein